MHLVLHEWMYSIAILLILYQDCLPIRLTHFMYSIIRDYNRITQRNWIIFCVFSHVFYERHTASDYHLMYKKYRWRLVSWICIFLYVGFAHVKEKFCYWNISKNLSMWMAERLFVLQRVFQFKNDNKLCVRCWFNLM